ncbi:Acyltransferase-like protein copy 2 [Leptomonas seymouri]|uniref:Acyltransferase-like protein copy 2 n=1 Tax=Leptomonas seymouri TaxID=5684 RepID=A0A0N0P455_LEPSE|nr:Acyltransferase-like protein copy 2 [Leptomonas seymouri]|eukprot:KPI84437.1 Acyltransferase-like protein copy 2 [Leptomonas seymouri]
MSATVSRLSSGVTAQLSQVSRTPGCGTALALTLGAGYLLLRYRLVPLWMMRKWFALSATAMVIPPCAMLYLTDSLRFLGIPRRWVQSLCLLIMTGAFRAVWWLNPQIRVTVTFDANAGGKPASWADMETRGIAMLMNHTSFWDAFEMIGVTPLSHLRHMRTLMKASLRRIPIFGGMFDRVGHFPVYFKSDGDGNFQVDKEKQAVVMKHVNWHLRQGGSIVVFPEGAVNKHPETLQTFRYGTFATIFEHRMPVYYMVSIGNEKTWPPQEAFGGMPADIRIRIGAFPIDFDKEDSKDVAKRLQQRMQQVRDEMAAEMAVEGSAPVRQSHIKLPATRTAAAAAA